MDQFHCHANASWLTTRTGTTNPALVVAVVCCGGRGHCLAAGGGGLVPTLKEVGVQEDSDTKQHALLVGRRAVWEVALECVRVGEDLGHQRLGLLHNMTKVRRITVGLSLIRRVDAERLLATSLSARVAFGAAVDAHAGAAGWLMDLEDGGAALVEQLEGRDAVPAVLLDASERVASGGERGLLVTAALAPTGQAPEGAVHRDDFGVSVELLDLHHVRVHRRAAESAHARGILERREDMVGVLVEVFEFGARFTPQEFLR